MGIMQTYSHLAIGVLAGAIAFPDNPAAQASCIIGSIAPDIILAPPFILDKWRGRQALTEQSGRLLQAKEVINSLPLSLLFVGFAFMFAGPVWLVAFLTGYTTHLIVDVLTHAGRQYADTDPSFAWPLRVKLGQRFGIGEYRYDFGVLKPKPAEIVILIITIIATAYFWLYPLHL